jgi:hypothetical protein
VLEQTGGRQLAPNAPQIRQIETSFAWLRARISAGAPVREASLSGDLTDSTSLAIGDAQYQLFMVWQGNCNPFS